MSDAQRVAWWLQARFDQRSAWSSDEMELAAKNDAIILAKWWEAGPVRDLGIVSEVRPLWEGGKPEPCWVLKPKGADNDSPTR